MDRQLTFEQSLRVRKYEPDDPNYTPRISGILHVENDRFNYAMSILKSNSGDPSETDRFTFAYENPKEGEGRFIHTYMNDANPLPSFEGEPEKVIIDGNIDEFTDMIWNSLNEDNKVSLFVRFIDIKTGKYDYILIEASGVCEPMPIAQELELIKNGKLDNVVGVVDAARLVDEFAGGENLLKKDQIEEEDIESLLIQQIEFCSTLVINKVDLVSESDLAKVRKVVQALHPGVKVFETSHGIQATSVGLLSLEPVGNTQEEGPSDGQDGVRYRQRHEW